MGAIPPQRLVADASSEKTGPKLCVGDLSHPSLRAGSQQHVHTPTCPPPARRHLSWLAGQRSKMAAIRRMDSSSASPLIRVAPLLLKQRNTFVALGAVGLSLGAAWAWNHRRKPDAGASELASDIAPKAVSPQKRHRSKRHKSKTKAPAECEQPLTECVAEPVPPPNASSPPASEPAAPAQAPPPRQQPAEQEQPQQVQETSLEATPEPEKPTDAGAESDGEPTASSTGCTQELDVEMTDVATDTDTANDATQSLSEQGPAAGEWRTVGRKQRRRRPSPPADCLDEPEPEATRAAEATAAAAEPAVKPPLPAEAAPAQEAARALAEPLATAPLEGGSELAPKKAKKKKKRSAPPASLQASEEEEPSPAAAEPAPTLAAATPSSAEELEALVDASPPPPAAVRAAPPAEVWVEVTARRGGRNKRPAAQEPSSPRSTRSSDN